ncbi:unnamed protein product [Rotaria magnacalcarata]|uniref:Uncharacterized protein n=1 Tax=Rotaria magnacalcarata TaxID=392030 RepID=A0A816R192_9BILA|nr:unnamed protein product [Rotaria magnacalcarata]CAF4161194.1 unnamed protein product [Rotaria magnacalcarata]
MDNHRTNLPMDYRIDPQSANSLKEISAKFDRDMGNLAYQMNTSWGSSNDNSNIRPVTMRRNVGNTLKARQEREELRYLESDGLTLTHEFMYDRLLAITRHIALKNKYILKFFLTKFTNKISFIKLQEQSKVHKNIKKFIAEFKNAPNPSFEHRLRFPTQDGSFSHNPVRERISPPRPIANFISPWEIPPNHGNFRPRNMRSETIHSSNPAEEQRNSPMAPMMPQTQMIPIMPQMQMQPIMPPLIPMILPHEQTPFNNFNPLQPSQAVAAPPTNLEIEYRRQLDLMKEEFEKMKQTWSREREENKEMRQRLAETERELSAVSSDSSRKSRPKDRVKNRHTYVREVSQTPDGMTSKLKRTPVSTDRETESEEYISPIQRRQSSPQKCSKPHQSVPPKIKGRKQTPNEANNPEFKTPTQVVDKRPQGRPAKSSVSSVDEDSPTVIVKSKIVSTNGRFSLESEVAEPDLERGGAKPKRRNTITRPAKENAKKKIKNNAAHEDPKRKYVKRKKSTPNKVVFQSEADDTVTSGADLEQSSSTPIKPGEEIYVSEEEEEEEYKLDYEYEQYDPLTLSKPTIKTRKRILIFGDSNAERIGDYFDKYKLDLHVENFGRGGMKFETACNDFLAHIQNYESSTQTLNCIIIAGHCNLTTKQNSHMSLATHQQSLIKFMLTKRSDTEQIIKKMDKPFINLIFVTPFIPDFKKYNNNDPLVVIQYRVSDPSDQRYLCWMKDFHLRLNEYKFELNRMRRTQLSKNSYLSHAKPNYGYDKF